MLRFILLLAGGSLAFAQQYGVTTIAGGAPPATPAPAGSVSIGQTGRVATDSAGNVYFSGGNSVFRMSTAGTLTLVAGNGRAGFSGDNGPAVNAQLNAPQGVAVDKSGNVYIADSQNNRVRVVTAAGVIRTFAGTGLVSPGGPRTFNDGAPAAEGLLHLPLGVAVDGSGNVYIADTGDNLIRKVDAEGIITTVAGDSYASYSGEGGNAVDAELNKPADVAVDSSGNLFIADTNNAAIRKVTTDGKIALLVGNLGIGSTGDGGDALKASLIAPMAVAVDSAGNIFIVENGSSKIRKVDSKNVITTIAGTGVAGFSGDGSGADKAQLNSPTGVAVDGSGNVYIADSLNLRIRKIAASTISTVAGNGVLSFSGDNGQATAAQLNGPQGVAVDAGGTVYIADTANHVVRRIRGGVITTYAGNRSAGFGGDGGAATSAQLNSPTGLAVDGAGNLYISDSANSRVRRVAANGTISTVAGNGTAGFGGDGSTATSANLYTPSGLAVDAAGNLYIADLSNNRVRKVTPGGTITTVAGNGSGGYAGDGGPAVNARLSLPKAVAVDVVGNLFIADAGNKVVRQVNVSGQISTIAGNPLNDNLGDGGPAVNAQLGNVAGIAVDAAGNLYVSDGGARVRKIMGGYIVTIAGSGVAGYSGDGSTGAFSQFNGVSGLAVDSSGNVYAADTGNNAVRLLQPQPAGLQIRTVSNGASNSGTAVAPGEVVVIYGSNLGPAALVQGAFNSAGSLPTSLAGTTVYFNNTPAPILYTSATQVATFVPFGLTGSTVRVAVQYQGQLATVSVPVTAVAPAIFTLGGGTGQAVAFNQDGTLTDAAHPAAAGAYVSIYATGTGETDPAGKVGTVSGAELANTVVPVTATVGGIAAPVQFAGAAPNQLAGVSQINVQIPPGVPPGPAALAIRMGGAPSQAGVTIVVR
jgi:trimeric autotransporter adhesin